MIGHCVKENPRGIRSQTSETKEHVPSLIPSFVLRVLSTNQKQERIIHYSRRNSLFFTYDTLKSVQVHAEGGLQEKGGIHVSLQEL